MRRARVSAPTIGVAIFALGISFVVASLAVAATGTSRNPFTAARQPNAPLTHATGTDGGWQKLPPPEGDQGAAAYDAARGRLLVFGGQDEDRMVTNALWSLSLSGTPAWTLLETTGLAPSARLGHVLLYDTRRDRLVLFGGADDMSRNDVWVLPLGTLPLQWTELTPTGTPPGRRVFAQAVYDSLADRLVLFGGADSLVIDGGPLDFRNDLWALSLSGTPAWSEITPAGTPPSPRAGGSAVYDRARQRLLLLQGYDGSTLADCFTLSLDGSPTWAPLGASGGPPPARCLSAVANDAPDDRVVIFGGLVDPATNDFLDDAWSLDLAGPAWTELSPTGDAPSARAFTASVYDPPQDRLVVYGGQSGMELVTDAVWSLSLGAEPAWANLQLGRPPARMAQASAYDPVHQVLVVHGGESSGATLDDLWSTPLGASPQWSPLTPAGTPPSARYGHSAIYDPLRDRFLFFGGQDGTIRMNDVWALTLGLSPAWEQLLPAGTPPAERSFHTAVYDPVGDQMVVFGGSLDGSLANDVWALSLAETPTWTQLSPAGTPPASRWLHCAAMDLAADRMIVFGGDAGGGNDNGVWALTLSGTPTWMQLSPLGTPPVARAGASLLSSSAHLILFGGEAAPGDNLNDAWLLTLYPSPAWRPLDAGPTLPTARTQATAALDVATFDLYVFGGNAEQTLNDLWVYHVNRTTGVLASLVSARAEPGRVDLAWQLSGGAARATVYRRAPGGGWVAIGEPLADGTGLLAFVDHDVVAGARYGYRLGLAGESGQTFAGEVWVVVPSETRLALRGLTPNPAPAGAALVTFSLPDASPARLDVLDVAGRRVFGREVGSLGGGEHVLRLGGGSLPAGLYLVRLTRGGRALTAKAVIVN